MLLSGGGEDEEELDFDFTRDCREYDREDWDGVRLREAARVLMIVDEKTLVNANGQLCR